MYLFAIGSLLFAPLMNPILFLDYSGVAVFAATGALAASRKQLDIIGFLFLAAVTGIGGGTFRDLILAVPVVWVVNPDYLAICAAGRHRRLLHRAPGRVALQAAAVARRHRARRLLGDGRGQGPCGDGIGVDRHRHGHADGDIRRHSARPAGRRAFGAAEARDLCECGPCRCCHVHRAPHRRRSTGRRGASLHSPQP